MQTKRTGTGSEVQVPVLALVLLGAASLYLTWSLLVFSKDMGTLVKLQQRRDYKMKPIDSYSFIGTDHPKRLPVDEKLIKMVVEESVHYDILAPEAETEWLWTATVGDGHVRIGKEQRMFAVAMFHELHCLRTIRATWEKGWHTLSEARQGHILHCFNYLRQYTLCAADTTLEPGDFTKRNFTKERTGATHTCLDWVPTYDFMTKKWFEWDAFRVAHGIPWHDEVT